MWNQPSVSYSGPSTGLSGHKGGGEEWVCEERNCLADSRHGAGLPFYGVVTMAVGPQSHLPYAALLLFLH